VTDPLDPAALRAQALERIKALSKLDEKSTTATTRALAKVLEERCTRLDEWSKVVKERQDLENPVPSPDKEAEVWKSELGRVKSLLEKCVKTPELLLPASLRESGTSKPNKTPEAVQAEIKEAIESAQAEVKDWSTKLEQMNADPHLQDGTVLAPIRTARDKVYKRLTILKTKNPEKESGTAEAKTPEARELAKETATNLEWETKVETERLRTEEARLALETRRVENAPIHKQMLEAHLQLAQASLDRLKRRYQELAASREKELHAKAVHEEALAKRANDPLERYRAKRAAELLDEQAREEASKNMLATDPPPSRDEQRKLADDAFKDFTEVKHLLDDGQVSHLDALRLTNDFRRIGPERNKIIATELAASAARLTMAENALSSVELELTYDGRNDRYELDGLLERLPRSRYTEAISLYESLEKEHFRILNERRAALVKLAARAQETHDQVLRRLQILDDHYGFTRTHIFWVRDEEPISSVTALQTRRELIQLGRATLQTASELRDRASWGRVSVEFLVSALGLVVLPWPLYRVRRVFREHSRRTHP
jgi:potassium efflux system protein